MTDYAELKRLAEAAPSGPWITENDSLYFKDDGYTRHLLDADAGHDVEDEHYYAALSYIAAANPPAVLALLAENERLRGIQPASPPRPPEGEGLPRYGLRWNGPQQPLAVLMADGYWTPWHLADQIKNENDQLRTQVQSMIDQTTPLVPVADDPMWSRRITIDELCQALADCTASLEGEVLQKYHGQKPEDMHPVTRRDYDRDMAEVEGYKALIKEPGQ